MNTKNTGDYVALIHQREDITEMFGEYLEEVDYKVETLTGAAAGDDFFDYLESNPAPKVALLHRITSKRAEADLPSYLHRLAPETEVVGLLTVRDYATEFENSVDFDFKFSGTKEEFLDDFYEALKEV